MKAVLVNSECVQFDKSGMFGRFGAGIHTYPNQYWFLGIRLSRCQSDVFVSIMLISCWGCVERNFRRASGLGYKTWRCRPSDLALKDDGYWSQGRKRTPPRCQNNKDNQTQIKKLKSYYWTVCIRRGPDIPYQPCIVTIWQISIWHRNFQGKHIRKKERTSTPSTNITRRRHKQTNILQGFVNPLMKPI